MALAQDFDHATKTDKGSLFQTVKSNLQEIAVQHPQEGDVAGVGLELISLLEKKQEQASPNNFFKSNYFFYVD